MTYLHPLIKIGQKGATVESNLQDMAVIRSLQKGEEKDALINEMILGNIPLIRLIVESYIGLHPKTEHLRDDMMSAGALALTMAIQDMSLKPEPEKDNPNGFIRQRVIWEMSRVVKEDCDQQKVPHDYTLPYPSEVDPRAIIETRDLLKAACLTQVDEVIIDMREKGCTDQEIADRLDIARLAVNLQRAEVEKRYNTLVRKNL